MPPRKLPTLVDDVQQAFEEYPPEQLEKMWQHKSYVMGAVLKTKPKVGGSNYPNKALCKHDPKKRDFYRGLLCGSCSVYCMYLTFKVPNKSRVRVRVRVQICRVPTKVTYRS